MHELNESGYGVSIHDRESGTISSDWVVFYLGSMFTKGLRVKENFLIQTVSDTETKVTLNLVYQKDLGKQSWVPASKDNKYTPKLYKEFFDYMDKKL